METQQKCGRTPAILLCNPRYHANIGAVIRAASCFNVRQLWVNSGAMQDDPSRLPREERMYADVLRFLHDKPFEFFDRGTVPVAVEILECSESLPEFEHPKNALYVFGPENGDIPKKILRHCHRFVQIPTRHCMNLAAAVNVVLYDRLVKLGE